MDVSRGCTVPCTHRFFRRFNKAVLDNACIDKEKARLEKENADLR